MQWIKIFFVAKYICYEKKYNPFKILRNSFIENHIVLLLRETLHCSRFFYCCVRLCNAIHCFITSCNFALWYIILLVCETLHSFLLCETLNCDTLFYCCVRLHCYILFPHCVQFSTTIHCFINSWDFVLLCIIFYHCATQCTAMHCFITA